MLHIPSVCRESLRSPSAHYRHLSVGADAVDVSSDDPPPSNVHSSPIGVIDILASRLIIPLGTPACLKTPIPFFRNTLFLVFWLSRTVSVRNLRLLLAPSRRVQRLSDFVFLLNAVTCLSLIHHVARPRHVLVLGNRTTARDLWERALVRSRSQRRGPIRQPIDFPSVGSPLTPVLA